MFELEFDPSGHQYVLIALGEKGFPTFKAIHPNKDFLQKVGKEAVQNKDSQFIQYQVLESNNVFALTQPDFRFDQALDRIIQNLILGKELPILSEYK